MSLKSRAPDSKTRWGMLSCVVKLRFTRKSANCKRFSFRPFRRAHMGNQWAHCSLSSSRSRPQLQTCTCNWRRCHVHHKFLMVPHALPLLLSRSRSLFLPLLLATCLQWPRALAAATIEATLKMQNRCENLEFFCNHNAFSVKSQRSHRHLHVRCVTLKLIIICQFRLSLCTLCLPLSLCHTCLPSLSGLH